VSVEEHPADRLPRGDIGELPDDGVLEIVAREEVGEQVAEEPRRAARGRRDTEGDPFSEAVRCHGGATVRIVK
jgi:hypothetical protein